MFSTGFNKHITLSSIGISLIISLAGCGNSSQISDKAEPRPVKPDSLQVPQAFHADNDIAMVVGSLADALVVNESFNPEVYNFSGVLTDGGGAPLYVDKNRNPGVWTVSVEAPAKAVITNSHDGDLVASDVVDYLTQCLHITNPPIDASETKHHGTRLAFSLPKGYLVFHAPLTMQGCRINITVTDSIPT